MSPSLDRSLFVYVTLDGAYGDHAELAPLASFAEAEGLSLLVPKDAADERGLEYDGAFCGIKLGVRSSLHAVGLTAAVSTALTDAGISANVIAATHHDYVFVPEADSNAALRALRRLGAGAEPG